MVKKKTKISKIGKKTPIMDLINKNPEVVPILLGYGLHCVGCSFSQFDTLEAGAKMHGMSDEDIKLMIKDVNGIISLKR